MWKSQIFFDESSSLLILPSRRRNASSQCQYVRKSDFWERLNICLKVSSSDGIHFSHFSIIACSHCCHRTAKLGRHAGRCPRLAALHHVVFLHTYMEAQSESEQAAVDSPRLCSNNYNRILTAALQSAKKNVLYMCMSSVTCQVSDAICGTLHRFETCLGSVT